MAWALPHIRPLKHELELLLATNKTPEAESRYYTAFTHALSQKPVCHYPIPEQVRLLNRFEADYIWTLPDDMKMLTRQVVTKLIMDLRADSIVPGREYSKAVLEETRTFASAMATAKVHVHRRLEIDFRYKDAVIALLKTLEEDIRAHEPGTLRFYCLVTRRLAVTTILFEEVYANAHSRNVHNTSRSRWGKVVDFVVEKGGSVVEEGALVSIVTYDRVLDSKKVEAEKTLDLALALGRGLSVEEETEMKAGEKVSSIEVDGSD